MPIKREIGVESFKKLGYKWPTSLVGQFLYLMKGKGKLIGKEEDELVMKIMSPLEKKESFTDLYNNFNLLAGLIMVFCISSLTVRIIPTTLVNTVWGESSQNSNLPADIYGVTISLCLVFACVTILFCVSVLGDMSLLSNSACELFFELVTFGNLIKPILLIIITLVLFMTAILLLISVNFSTWVFYTVMTTFGILVIWIVLLKISFYGARIEAMRYEIDKLTTN